MFPLGTFSSISFICLFCKSILSSSSLILCKSKKNTVSSTCKTCSDSQYARSPSQCCATVNETVVQQFMNLLHMLSLFLIMPSVSMVSVLGKKQLLWQPESRFSSESTSFSILEPLESWSAYSQDSCASLVQLIKPKTKDRQAQKALNGEIHLGLSFRLFCSSEYQKNVFTWYGHEPGLHSNV